MSFKLRGLGPGALAAVLAVAALGGLGLWPRTVLADLPNCAEYPKACANYGQSSGLSGIVIAGLILLGVVLIVAAVLTVIIVRRRRRSPGARAPSDFDQPR